MFIGEGSTVQRRSSGFICGSGIISNGDQSWLWSTALNIAQTILVLSVFAISIFLTALAPPLLSHQPLLLPLILSLKKTLILSLVKPNNHALNISAFSGSLTKLECPCSTVQLPTQQIQPVSYKFSPILGSRTNLIPRQFETPRSIIQAPTSLVLWPVLL